jgi:pectate disaccharide-lyase
MHIPRRFYIAGGLILIMLAIAIPLIVIGLQQQQQQGSGGQSTPTPAPGSTPTVSSTITPVGGGKAYYVSPSGSDQNDGSQAHPFATIQKAADVVTPGSVVHVLPGTYNESILVETDGTANARITFMSDTKWAAKIHTTNTDDPWKTNADYIDIIGFDISSDGSRDGIVNNGSYTRTIGNRVHNIPGVCDSIGGSGITDNNFKAHDNDIIGNLVFNIGSTYPKLCQYVHAIYHSNARGEIVNNIAYDNAGCGINLWHAATDTVVDNNLVFNNKEHGISIGTNKSDNNHDLGDNFIVANNISIDNALLGIRERKGVGSHDQFLNNIVYGNGDAAFGDENYDWPSSAGSKDVNTITQNVQFVNFQLNGSGDYHLKANSPAIGAGTSVGAPSTDFDGKPRPQGKIDIGPYQYQ